MDDQEIITRLWDRFRDRAEEHVDLLEAWHRGGASDHDALQAAHKLAGSLGSYGRPEGSRAALALERRLSRVTAGEVVADRAGEVDELLRELRDAVS